MTNNYPALYVTLKRLMEIRGETKSQVEYWREHHWIEGAHYKKIKKGKRDHYEYNVREIDAWIHNQNAA